jgi:hypothetical protein
VGCGVGIRAIRGTAIRGMAIRGTAIRGMAPVATRGGTEALVTAAAETDLVRGRGTGLGLGLG